MQRHLKKVIVSLCVALLSFLPLHEVYAATLSITSPTPEVSLGKPFTVSVLLAGDGESVNAIEGSFTYDKEKLQLVSVSDAQTVISFWVKPPRSTDTTVFFSGIIPGGFSSLVYPDRDGVFPGPVLTLTFTPLQLGVAHISFDEAQTKVVLHDGSGTQARLQLQPVTVDVVEAPFVEDVAGETTETLPTNDTTPPTILEAQVLKEKALLNNQYVLVFAVKDMESGVALVEVKEGEGAFVPAESPYVLKKQTLDSIITLRVVDHAGNERMLQINPASKYHTFSLSLFAGVLGVVVVLLIIAIWYRKRKVHSF